MTNDAELDAAIALVERVRALGCKLELFDTGSEHPVGRLLITPPVYLSQTAEWTRLQDAILANRAVPGVVLYLQEEGEL
jgi:hypothetical protein